MTSTAITAFQFKQLTKQQQLERYIEASMELQKTIHHLPVDLGIKAFKRDMTQELNEFFPGLKNGKAMIRKLVKAYKKRAWAEYHGKARDRGTFPTHNAIGTHLKVETTEEETTIKVKKK